MVVRSCRHKQVQLFQSYEANRFNCTSRCFDAVDRSEWVAEQQNPTTATKSSTWCGRIRRWTRLVLQVLSGTMAGGSHNFGLEEGNGAMTMAQR